MKGSVLIVLLFILAATSFLLIAASSIMEAHILVSQAGDRHQTVYYLAETGINSAIAELTRVTEQVLQECLSDFEWDPINEPLLSLQESAGKHVANELGPKLNSRLASLGYFSDFPDALLPEPIPQSSMDVRIYMPKVYSNPAALQVISTGTIGKIRRRIDAYLNINKVSNVYDSKLFDMVFLSGDGVDIINNGALQIHGSLYSQGDISVNAQSMLNIDGKVFSKHSIRVQGGSSADFLQDVICRSLSVSGAPPPVPEAGSANSNIICSGDIFAYNTIEAYGFENTIDIKGKLYAAIDDLSSSAGVIARDGGKITLEDDIFINGTLNYPTFGQSLFGLEEIPLSGDTFHSNESIGGNNHAFYFPGSASGYVRNFFRWDYLNLSNDAKMNLLYEYLTKPPGLEEDLPAYEAHTAFLDKNSISLLKREPDSGYASGLIFADGQIIRKNSLQQPDKFFQGILTNMKRQVSWNYENQLKPTISVPNCNISPEGTSFTVQNPESPFVYILPEQEDVTLPSGEYSGILYTDGSIRVSKGDSVTFTGLMIAGGKLVVEGSLTMKEDKNLLLRLLDAQGKPLMSFFRINPEKPLVEIQSCREHLYNEK